MYTIAVGSPLRNQDLSTSAPQMGHTLKRGINSYPHGSPFSAFEGQKTLSTSIFHDLCENKIQFSLHQ